MPTSGNINSNKWTRKLYLKQAFSDNYVDADTFLTQLRRNVDVPVYTFRQLAHSSLTIVQHLAVILAFLACFLFVFEGGLSVNSLIVLANGSTVVAYGSWVVYMRNEIKCLASKSSENDLRSRGRRTIIHGLIFTLLLMLFSPILKTLTEDTSSDTIWAISSCLFILCWIAQDYSQKDDLPSGALTKHYTSPFSLNCAMLGSIALASRLPSVTHVFGFLSLAVNVFAFLPILSRIIRRLLGTFGDITLTVFTVCFTFSLWWTVFPPVALIFASVVLFINLICPLWLVHLQKFKNNIHGPWDEATIKKNND